jgi:hypothetical protein
MTLEAPVIGAKDEDHVTYNLVTAAQDVPAAFLFWMSDQASRMLHIGAFFYAISIMAQIPGGAQHRFIFCDKYNPTVPGDDDDPMRWVGEHQPQAAFDVLEECLYRLGVPHLIKQIPGAKKCRPRRLSQEYRDWLDRFARVKDGLLNVVAECLDTLIVLPAEQEARALPQRWHDWFASRTLHPAAQKGKKPSRKRGAGDQGAPAPLSPRAAAQPRSSVAAATGETAAATGRDRPPTDGGAKT